MTSAEGRYRVIAVRVPRALDAGRDGTFVDKTDRSGDGYPR